MKSVLTARGFLFLVFASFLTNGALLSLGTRHLSEDYGWVIHAQQVQSAVRQVRIDLIPFNESARGIWMARQTEPLSLAASKLQQDATGIQQLTIDNLSQQRHVQQLHALLSAHILTAEETPASSPGRAALIGRLDQSTDRIWFKLKEMDEEEASLLQQRRNRTSLTAQRINIGLLAETVVGVLLAFSMYFFYARARRRERRSRLRSALERDLREKRIDALSHMTGGLAHEIDNPLAIIHALASDLRSASGSGTLLPPEVLQSTEDIVKAADHATAVLRSLRGFGREAAHDPLELASIYAIVDQCVDLQQARLDSHHIELRVNLYPALPDFLCREDQIGQILTNLIENAFDAIVAAGSPVDHRRWISIQAQPLPQALRLDVCDSGSGVEGKYRPHLLDPFFTTKQHGFGMGLGLSLSRVIAEDHGGSLFLVENTPTTCFRLILPYNPATTRVPRLWS